MSASLRSVDGQDEASILREIQSALRDLRFGAVEITVHNAQVVQIERKEKFRLQNPGKQQGRVAPHVRILATPKIKTRKKPTTHKIPGA